MEKTIIAVYGSQQKGKSETIKNIYQLILPDPNASLLELEKENNFKQDILLTIQFGNFVIGLESQGDPYGRSKQTLPRLAKKGCDIIVCASRTRGETVNIINKVAEDHDYHTLWISSFYSPKLDHKVLNKIAALNIIKIIKTLINSLLSENE